VIGQRTRGLGGWRAVLFGRSLPLGLSRNLN
jgi:hypothetical protein